uniref:Uncharacterized protein n=1 Tax=Populus davidiana TaxID=266767 RepID=A0A6M2EYU4_9ROSI
MFRTFLSNLLLHLCPSFSSSSSSHFYQTHHQLCHYQRLQPLQPLCLSSFFSSSQTSQSPFLLNFPLQHPLYSSFSSSFSLSSHLHFPQQALPLASSTQPSLPSQPHRPLYSSFSSSFCPFSHHHFHPQALPSPS